MFKKKKKKNHFITHKIMHASRVDISDMCSVHAFFYLHIEKYFTCITNQDEDDVDYIMYCILAQRIG